MTIFTKFTPCGTCRQSIPSSLVTLHAKACSSRGRRGYTEYGDCALCGHSYPKAQWTAHEASEMHRVKLAEAADARLGGAWTTVRYWGHHQIGVMLELPETRIATWDVTFAGISMPRETDKAVKLVFAYSYHFRSCAHAAGRKSFWSSSDYTSYVVVTHYLAPYLREHESLPEWMQQTLWSQALGGPESYPGKNEITSFFQDLGFDTTGYASILEAYAANARQAIAEFTSRSVK